MKWMAHEDFDTNMNILLTISMLPAFVCFVGILAIETTKGNDGICMSSNTDNYQFECCANFYKFKSTCKICPNGTTSKQGDNECRNCDQGYYGAACVFKCNNTCSSNVCNRVNGSCFTVTTTVREYIELSSTEVIGVTDSIQSKDIFIISYGSLIGLSILTITLGLTAILTVVKRKQIKSVSEHPTQQTTQCSEEANLYNHYASIREADMATNIRRKSISLPDILDPGKNSNNIFYSLPAKSEGYLNPYQPLQSGWESRTPVYDKRKHDTIISNSFSDYCTPQRTESNEIEVTAEVHAANRESKA